MSRQLGTLEELPQDYGDAMSRAGIGPLWPQLRNALPHERPKPVTLSNLWTYSTLRPLPWTALALARTPDLRLRPRWPP